MLQYTLSIMQHIVNPLAHVNQLPFFCGLKCMYAGDFGAMHILYPQEAFLDLNSWTKYIYSYKYSKYIINLSSLKLE
jgi:hypothetical protein